MAELIVCTKHDIEMIFAEWQRRWMVNPEDFLDQDTAEDYAEVSADYFIELYYGIPIEERYKLTDADREKLAEGE